jgi:hypothetical protein
MAWVVGAIGVARDDVSSSTRIPRRSRQYALHPQRGSRYRKPVQLLQKDAGRTEGKHNENSQGKARRRVLALPNGQTSVASSANSILQARERDVERVIPRTPSIAGAAPSGFSGSSTAFVAAFPHCEVHAIRDRNTQYPFPLLLPRHCSRLWRDKAPSRYLCASRLPSLSWP